MNQKIEIKKIKVNNGSELIAKAREYKNSGGEWKLRERYIEMPTGKGTKGGEKKYLEWGIIIGNGKQEIDIRSAGNNVKSRSGPNDEVNNRDELEKLFTEGKLAPFVWSENERLRKLNYNTLKRIKETDGEYDLVRYLIAENSWHLKQILHEYVRDNETKIYQSPNPHFGGWVEIVESQDGNIYLYVGRENNGGGREIKIGIVKGEFEKCIRNNDDTPYKCLGDFWALFTIGRPRTPAETHEYYSKNGGLEQEWQRNSPHFGKLVPQIFRGITERLNQRLEYWKIDKGMCGTTTIVYIDAIDHELESMKKNRPAYYAACDKDCAVCGVKLCCHFEGRTCLGDKNWARADKNLLHFYGRINEDNQLTDKEKSQLFALFQKYNIKKITLESDKLIIEYNGSQTENEALDNQELEKYREFLQNSPFHSISLRDLQQQNNSRPPQTNSPNNKLAIGLILGAGATIILGGIIIYFWKKSRPKRA